MGAASKGRPGEVLIKKYGNRRLYDTSQSRYITLDDLSEIVRDGATIRVVEASSNRDLTRQVLTQVILERQEALDMVPVELLTALIRVQGTLEQAPLAAFLATVTRQFVQSGSLWTRQLTAFFEGSFPGAPSPPAPAAEPPQASEPEEPPEEPPQAEDEPPEIDDIRQRMDALLGKLGKR